MKGPVIVIGMHRSGTGLLIRMLEMFGVFFGAEKDINSEAVGFLNLNRRLFRMANCGWDNPEPVSLLIENAELKQAVVERLGRSMDRRFLRRYLGAKRSIRRTRFEGLDFPWGWKDPRNTYTLPLWLALFPEARVIHIHRHGVDVAQSLFLRETQRPGGLDDPDFSPLCQNLSNCFELWRSYVSQARRNLALSSRTLEFSFEDLLAEPRRVLAEATRFCGVGFDEKSLDQAVSLLDPKKRFAFLADPGLISFYEQVKGDPLMIELGYE